MIWNTHYTLRERGDKIMRTFYVTTPIYYVNAEPHLGTAYSTIAADVLARYHRLKGEDVFFLTGVDEHGENIQTLAAEKGISEQELCDQMAPMFTKLWKKLNLSNDIFLRTTSELHKRGATKFLNALYKTGDIYKGKYDGYYCRRCESFYTERELAESKNCPVHKLPVEWVEEENYFFALSKYQDGLRAHIRANPEFIQPESRRNEVLNVVESGLKDVSISRASVSWGIPLPFDQTHMTYVWIEALCNYITALGYGEDGEKFHKYWPANVHMMGKDITRFHAIIWPAMLMAVNLPLPRQIFAHGFVTNQGEKISKTKGNVIDMDTLIGEFGLDAFRYFFLREFSFGNDGDYSQDRFVLRYNADLANDLGNLLNRTLGLVSKNFGVIPEPTTPGEFDDEVKGIARETIDQVDALMGQLAFDMALEKIWEFVRRINRYVQQTQVWSLAKSEETKGRMGTILYNCMESLRTIAVLISPFVPDTANRIRQQMGLDECFENQGLDTVSEWGGLPSGKTVGKPEPIFPRKDTKRKPRHAASSQTEQIATENLISIDQFQSMDLRVAEVIAAERIPNADRLLKLQVDLGSEKRQVVAGIAAHYSPEDLVGKQIVLVANLKPTKIRGIESQGMLLAASGKKELAVATFEKRLPPGTQVR
ncbi:MAG: methionine--tRNA ligase [Candidatus Poribacteria bacterium]|nr:methionine--tRNA ligase [Candidatus Poribacteria bacterium]